MSHFYLTLPSNSSEKFFPNNTLAQFTTKLQDDVTLYGEWEVGLSEIVFPKTWYNIGEEQYISIICHECRDVTPEFATKPRKRSYTKTILMTPGYYKTMKEIIDEINTLLEFAYSEPIDDWKDGDVEYFVTEMGRPKFIFNAVNNKVRIRVPGRTILNLTKNIQQILGFISTDKVGIFNKRRRPLEFRGEQTADVDCGRHALYVYCDLLEHVPVGDTTAPLLRIVDINGESGSMVHKYYEKPRYVPLQKKHFGSLEIHIRDSFGEKIPFESGTVIVTLHFRKTKGSYFLA